MRAETFEARRTDLRDGAGAGDRRARAGDVYGTARLARNPAASRSAN